MRINVEIKVCHIFRTGSLRTSNLVHRLKHDDPYLTSAMSSTVKGQGCNLQGHVVHLTGVGFAHKSRTKSSQNIKIVKKIAHLTGNNVHQVRDQRLMSPDRLMLKPEVCYKLNFKLGRQFKHALSTAMARYIKAL